MSNNPKPWITRESKVIHKTKWIEIIEDTCLNNEAEFKYTYAKKVDEGPVIIAEENDGSIWLVQQYRHPIKKIIWQLPIEGKLLNESWDAAAKRGLKEELQIEAKKWKNLGEYYPDPGFLEQKYQIYIATDLVRDDSTKLQHLADEPEDLNVRNFSRKEIDEMISNGEICDNWTLAGLYLFDRHKSN
jgi:ADP-ribose pyrophosphatase